MKTSTNWYVVALVIFFISETLYNVLTYFNISEIRMAGSIKLVAQVLMLTFLLIYFKQNKRNIILIFTICVLYVFGQLMLPNNKNLFLNLEHLANSTFLIVLFIFFNTLILSVKQKKNALKAFETIIMLNSLVIILGFIFNIEFFRTYKASRFGYDGLIIKASYASYFYLIGLFYYTNKFWIKKEGNFFIYLIILIATILTGTKASLLVALLCFVYLFVKKKVYKKKIIVLAMFISSLILVKIAHRSYNFILNKLDTFGSIISNDGIFTAIFSFRNQLLVENTLPFINDNWSSYNWLFGGMGNVNLRSGFDVFDLVYYFGIVGSLIYVYMFKINYCTFKHNFDNLFFLLILVSITLLGGNLFYNSSVAIFLYGIKLYFELNYENKNT